MFLFALVIVVAIVWALAAPGQRFIPAFANLLTEPVIQRGAFSFFSGRSYLSGKFQNREMAIRLQLKRSNYGQGYFVVALRTPGVHSLDYDRLDARVRDDAGRRALSALAGHSLLLNVEEGWLKALWRPQGFGIFPGAFSEQKWRQVLESMQAVASSLEAGT